jgi:hypothetical protein
MRVNMDVYQQTTGTVPTTYTVPAVAPTMYTYPSAYTTGYYYQPGLYNPALTTTTMATPAFGAYICCEKKPSLLEEAKEFIKDRFKRKERTQHIVTDINVIHNVAAPEEIHHHHSRRDHSADSAKKGNTTINIEHKPTIINDFSYVDKSTNTTTNHYHEPSGGKLKVPNNHANLNRSQEDLHLGDLHRQNSDSELYPRGILRRSLSNEDMKNKNANIEHTNPQQPHRVNFNLENNHENGRPVYSYNPNPNLAKHESSRVVLPEVVFDDVRYTQPDDILKHLPQYTYTKNYLGSIQKPRSSSSSSSDDEKSKHYNTRKANNSNQMFYHGQESQGAFVEQRYLNSSNQEEVSRYHMSRNNILRR